MADIRVENVKSQTLVIECPGRTLFFTKKNEQKDVPMCDAIAQYVQSGQLRVVDWYGNEPDEDLENETVITEPVVIDTNAVETPETPAISPELAKAITASTPAVAKTPESKAKPPKDATPPVVVTKPTAIDPSKLPQS